MNNSSNDLSVKIPESTFVLLLAVNLTGIAGNILLIIAHIKDPLKLLKCSSSVFIINISVIDVLISCTLFVCMLYSLVVFDRHWNDPSRITSIVILFMRLFLATIFVSYLSLAIERFCSVAFPLWHRARITNRVCRYWVIGIWLVFIALYAGNVVLLEVLEIRLQSDFATIVFMCVLLALTQCVYLASYISIRKQSMRLQRRHGIGEVTARTIKLRLENEKNFLSSIVIICFALVVTVLPFLILSLTILTEAIKSWKKN